MTCIYASKLFSWSVLVELFCDPNSPNAWGKFGQRASVKLMGVAPWMNEVKNVLILQVVVKGFIDDIHMKGNQNFLKLR